MYNQVWEHYSSIRNLDGPHTGLPEIKESRVSSGDENEPKKKPTNTPVVAPWMVKVVMTSLPYLVDQQAIQTMIEECKGDVNAAVSKLLDAEAQSSASSARGSSSVERDVDSDDEEPVRGPKKRQDRRLSTRAPPTFTSRKEERCSQDLSLRMKGEHRTRTIEHPLPLNESNVNGVPLEDADETEEEDWRNSSPYKDSESASVSTSASELSTASKPRSGGVRLKLSQPKQYKTSSSSYGDRHGASTKPTYGYSSRVEPRPLGQQKQRKLASRSTLETMKKADRKAAAKERKRSVAAGRAVSGPSATIPLMTKQDKENTFEAIKVLYI